MLALCCSPSLRIEIGSPALGDFLGGGGLVVVGQVTGPEEEGVHLLVDGLALPTAGDGAFSTELAVEPDRPFRAVDLALRREDTGELFQRRRITTVVGEAGPADERVAGGIAIRLSDLALDTIASEFAAAVEAELDVETLIRESNPVASESECIVDTPLGCAAKLKVEADIEKVDFAKLKVNADSRNDFLKLEVILKHLEIEYDTDGDIDCKGRIRTDKVTVPGDYLVAPDALKPWRLDVDLVPDSLYVKLEGFDHEFTGGVCDAPIVDDVVEDLLGDIDDLLRDALEEVLDDPDGSGRKDSPVAEGVEDAIDYRSLWAPLGEALGVGVDTHLGAAVADRKGLTIDFDLLVGEPALDCEPGPDLAAALRVPSVPIEWGELTPGGQPYDLAVALSASALNQMMRARVACGWLRSSIDTLDLGSGPVPLDAGLLAILVPDFAAIAPDTPLTLELEPVLAPLVTGELGPAGELLDLWLSHWKVSVVDPNQSALIELVIELRAGVGLALGADGASLEFALGTVPGEAIRSAVVRSLLDVDEAQVAAAVAALVPVMLDSFGLDLDPIPLPELIGLQLVGVEMAPVGDQVVAFLGLAPETPPAP
ncbi:MAG: hypothetical protein ACQGVK_18850 [Myxococcota bacterium]